MSGYRVYRSKKASENLWPETYTRDYGGLEGAARASLEETPPRASEGMLAVVYEGPGGGLAVFRIEPPTGPILTKLTS